ncbi:hypothetical protein DXG01_014109 [Tephrocybe rancida]|nr:hypothetical protein DXG01_014109 [Tephrocybe rancida]
MDSQPFRDDRFPDSLSNDDNDTKDLCHSCTTVSGSSDDPVALTQEPLEDNASTGPQPILSCITEPAVQTYEGVPVLDMELEIYAESENQIDDDVSSALHHGDIVTVHADPTIGGDGRDLVTLEVLHVCDFVDSSPLPGYLSLWGQELKTEDWVILRVKIGWVTLPADVLQSFVEPECPRFSQAKFEIGTVDMFSLVGYSYVEVIALTVIARTLHMDFESYSAR